MVRVHFTPEDLMRVRFCDEPAPLLELGLALASLKSRRIDPVFARWRRGTALGLPTPARPLLQLLPADGAGPLFLDPVSEGLEDGLDIVLNSPTPFVQEELRRVCSNGLPQTPWMGKIAMRDRESWQELAKAVRTAYEDVVAEPWQRMRSAFHAEVAWRSRQLGRLGVGDLLTSLLPGSWWEGTTWVFRPERRAELALDGKGLTLHPSAFWRGGSLIGDHPDGSYLLVYPALTPLPLIDEPRSADPLGTLLGRTRAAVLESLAEQQTTSQLARSVGISLASASLHARTLREAGLIATRRDGKTAWHGTTALGVDLLAASVR